MPKGGRREGAGRKKGSENKTTKAARDLLLENRERIIKRSIDLALDKETPNVQLLSKLLDKLIPTLQSIDQTNSNLNTDVTEELTKEQRQALIDKLMKKFAK